jgi:hypothetical protein
VRFNAEDESVSVGVAPGSTGEDETWRDLRSTTGAVVVGTGRVTPATGPVGTEHQVRVDVLDDYEVTVTRVSVTTSGDRGDQVHELIRDSADAGLWIIGVQSLGEADETRTDTFTFELWRRPDEGEDTDAEGTAG